MLYQKVILWCYPSFHGAHIINLFLHVPKGFIPVTLTCRTAIEELYVYSEEASQEILNNFRKLQL